MEQNEILALLDRAIAGRNVLSIERPELCETELLCVPIARSEELLLVHVFYDFHPDGYRIIRLEDIFNVIREGSEEFFERIIIAEGVHARLASPGPVDLTSWRSALASLGVRYAFCTIECDGGEEFLIGKVVELGEWDLTFWYFDATGKWDDETDIVDYDDLSAVSFDDNYTNTIIKYIN